MKQIDAAVKSAILESRVRADDAAATTNATLAEILNAVRGVAEENRQIRADFSSMKARLDAFEAAGAEPEPRTDNAEPQRDEELHAKIDALGEHVLAAHKRMDDFEQGMKGGGTEPTPAVGDSAEPTEPKTDSAPCETQPEPKTDSAPETEPKADSANAALLARIADLEKRVPPEQTAEQRATFATVRTDWDKVYRAYGDSAGAPGWWTGETVAAYRQRLMAPYKQHSKAWKDASIDAIGKDESILSMADSQIRADAMDAVMRPAPGTMNGRLRMVQEEDENGLKKRRFVGDVSAFTGPFKAPVRRLAKITTRFAA